jgi:hypothetical protein
MSAGMDSGSHGWSLLVDIDVDSRICGGWLRCGLRSLTVSASGDLT